MGMHVPPELEGVLDWFVDQISKNISKELPPRWETNHHIELEPRTQTMAKGPYQLSRLELEEWKEQLNELYVGLIRPSRSPYSALFLF